MASAALRSGNQPFCPYLEEKGGPNKTELSALNGSKNEKGSCKRMMQAPQSGRTALVGVLRTNRPWKELPRRMPSS